MLFSKIIGQEKLKERLIDTVKRQRISHAQLFLGNTNYKFVFIFSGFEIKITNSLFILVLFGGISFNSFLQEPSIKTIANNKSVFFIV